MCTALQSLGRESVLPLTLSGKVRVESNRRSRGGEWESIRGGGAGRAGGGGGGDEDDGLVGNAAMYCD